MTLFSANSSKMGVRGASPSCLRKLAFAGVSLTALFLVMPATPSFAQNPNQPVADDSALVVTARKREEKVYDTPTALAVLGPVQLDEQNIGSVEDVGKYVPNLTITRYGVGNSAQAAIFIRGIGLQDHIITTDPGVGVYLDGVYLGRQLGSNLSLVNIERIEVLRGPQGTLYGRNSLGGAVNIITSNPNGKTGAEVNLQTGSRGRVAANVYAEFPLSDTFSLGVSTYFKRRNGVGDFLLLPNPEARIGEEQEFGGRVKARWEASDRLTFIFSIDGLQGDNGQSPYTTEVNGIGVGPGDNFTPGTPTQSRSNPFAGDFFALQPGFRGSLAPFLPAAAGGRLTSPNPDDSFSTVAGLESTTNSAWGVSLTTDLAVTDNVSTKLLGSYRYSDYTGGLDDDETPLNLSEFPELGNAKQVSVEWQWNVTQGIADFVGGLYYFREEGTTQSGPFVFSPFNAPNSIDNFGVPINLGFPTGLGNFDLNQTTNAYAVYGNIKFNLSDKLSGGGGLRWSRDAKDANALFPSFGGNRVFREANFSELTWDVNALYHLSDTINTYLEIQKGYQTGGFPPRPFGGPAQFVSFDEQTAINYEVGLKGAFLGGRVQGSLSLFLTRYRDLALPFSDTTAGGGFVTIVENAGRSRSRGVELDALTHVFGGFSVNTTLGFLDSRITRVDAGVIGIAQGDRPALTPRWTASVAPKYDFEAAGGVFTVTGNWSYRGGQFGQSINRASEFIRERGLYGFSLSYARSDSDWKVSIYGENVSNTVYDQGRLQQTGFVGIVRSNDRSEFGIKLSKKFGGL